MVNLRNKKGIILNLSYLIIIFIGILAGVSAYRAHFDLRMAQENVITARALYLAEAGLAYGIYECAQQAANPNAAVSSPAYPSYTPPPSFFGGPRTGNINILLDSNPDYLFTSAYTGYNIIYDCFVLGPPAGTLMPPGAARNFMVTATASYVNPDGSAGITVTLNQVFRCQQIYTFQHAIFYTDDLELLPGANMDLTGNIHTNSDLYIGTHNRLRIQFNNMHSAGNIYNRRKDSTQAMNGEVWIESAPGTLELMKRPGEDPLDSDRADWRTESQVRWNGNVKSSVHGVTSMAVPSVGSIKRNGFYATTADIKIINDTVISSGGDQTKPVHPDAVRTTSTFYNNREGKWVTMVEVDMEKMAGWENADDKLDLDGSGPNYRNCFVNTNGLMYVSGDPDSGQQPGVRLINGYEIERSNGLTVVSDNPLYIQGDYNIDNWKPCAVICDAANILSNNWDDAKSRLNLSNRVASDETYVYTAFISGVDSTAWGDYNGGVENYPRFHEKWSGKTLFIRGSFVELWNSEVAQGSWYYGNPQYEAPNRNWDYEARFNNPANLPPYTPFAVQAEEILWWKS